MTKKLFGILAMLFALATPAMAVCDEGGDAGGCSEDALSVWTEVRAARKQPTEAVVYVDKYLTDSVGFYAQAVKDSAGYSSLYAGPKFKVAEGIEIGIGIGREVLERGTPSTIVRNAWISADGEQFALYATVEHGAYGTWHKETAMYKMSSNWNIGAKHETGLGIGPQLEYSMGKFQVWSALLRRHGVSTPQVGVNFSHEF